MVVRFLPFFCERIELKNTLAPLQFSELRIESGERGDVQKMRVLSGRTSLKRMQSVGGVFSSLEKETFCRASGNGNDFFTAPMKALTDKLRSQSFLVSATRRRNDNQISHHSDYLIAQRSAAKAYRTRINPLPHGKLIYLMLVPRSTHIYTRALFHDILCCFNFADIHIFSMICNWINLSHHRNKSKTFPLVSRRKLILCKLIRFTLSI